MSEFREVLNYFQKQRSSMSIHISECMIPCKNGTLIILPEFVKSRKEYEMVKSILMSTFRFKEDGTVSTMRKALVIIRVPKENTDQDYQKIIGPYSLYDDTDPEEQWFSPDHYLLPEKVINEFIKDSGGIAWDKL